MSEYSVIGESVPRIGAKELVTGEAKFCIDEKLPGMLWGKILRSPVPHARILRIDISAAEKLPGVKTVITGGDFNAKAKMAFSPQAPPLAKDRVLYIGEPVVAVAAIDESVATEALDLITVEYEELPAVFDMEEAIQPGAPRIGEAEGNIGAKFDVSRGDAEEGFIKADFIVEDRFITPPQNHVRMEPGNCIASFDLSGRLTIFTQQTMLFSIRSDVANVMNMREHQVKVVQPLSVGGHFGAGGATPRSHFIASMLAKKTDRPIKIVNTREEEFLSTYPLMPYVVEMKMGVKKDGTITAKKTRIIGDSGAYFSMLAMSILSVAMMRHENLYRFENVETEAILALTNRVPSFALRGFGNQAGHFALESMMDQLAESIGMDPAEIRLKNAIQTGDTSVHGWVIRSGGLTECIRKSTEKAKWKRKRNGNGGSNRRLKRGQGMGSALHVTAMKYIGQSWGCGALVKINDDGTVNLITGEGDCGQGARTVLSQICAEELAVPFEDVWAAPSDTDFAPYTGGPVSSKTTATAGTAVKLAAADAKRQLFASAAEKLNVDVNELEAENRRIYIKNTPEKVVTYAEAAMGPSFRPIIGKGIFIPAQPGTDFRTWYGDCATSYSFCNQVVEVEVDTETGEVKVTNFAGAFDLGKAINPKAAEGQIEGGLAMGIGWAMSENLEPLKGHIVDKQFTDYKLTTTLEMPVSINSILVETNDPVCPFGAKGIGEVVLVPTAAAIANAIYDAVGIRIRELPITPEKILKAMQDKAAL